jgi:hypothetical protein
MNAERVARLTAFALAVGLPLVAVIAGLPG